MTHHLQAFQRFLTHSHHRNRIELTAERLDTTGIVWAEIRVCAVHSKYLNGVLKGRELNDLRGTGSYLKQTFRTFFTVTPVRRH